MVLVHEKRNCWGFVKKKKNLRIMRVAREMDLYQERVKGKSRWIWTCYLSPEDGIMAFHPVFFKK